MKFTWEEKDILVGTRYSRPGIQEVWMIGYLANPEQDHRRFVSVSMSDGMVTVPYSREEMLHNLNEAKYVREDLMPFCS